MPSRGWTRQETHKNPTNKDISAISTDSCIPAYDQCVKVMGPAQCGRPVSAAIPSPNHAVEPGISHKRSALGADQAESVPGVGMRCLARKRNKLMAEILADLIARSVKGDAG
jgi:hypothetical protein